MSTLVDERVVELSFDNSNFEKNTKETMRTLDEFNKSLDFSKSAKSINDSINSINMDSLIYGLANAKQSFSAWEVAVISVISNITNRITNLGIRLVESLSVDNISSGWLKYGENVKSVGTLLSQDGNTIDNVTASLQKLMWFTDQTSYSYTDMVSNISKFTATGQSLEDSVQAMMGIANWAALSGQNAATASRAMYQLSQAMGQGTVRLMDYRSIQNANMDTTEFRKNVIKTAVDMGYLIERIDGIYVTTEKALEAGKEFNQSQFTSQLSSGWFTSDVLVNTLSKYSTAVDKLYKDTSIDKTFETAAEAIEAYEQQLEEAGTEQEKFGLKAFKAAQEARTFEDVINATKDAVSSGWLSTFDKIFGDYNESKRLWTDLADELWDVFAAGGEERNNILSLWKDLGGRKDIFDQEIGAFWNLFYAVKNVISAIKDSYKSIFGLGRSLDEQGTYTENAANRLKNFTSNLSALTKRFKDFTENEMTNFKNTVRGIFSILNAFVKTVKAIWKGINPIFSLVSTGIEGILSILGEYGDKFTNLINSTTAFNKISTVLSSNLVKIINNIKDMKILSKISELIQLFRNSFANVVKEANVGSRIFDGLVSIFKIISSIFVNLSKILSEAILPLVYKLVSFVTGTMGSLSGYIVKFVANIADLITQLATFLSTSEKVRSIVDGLIEFIKKIPVILSPLIPLLQGIKNIAKNLLDIIVELPKALARLFEKITGNTIGSAFKILGQTIVDAVDAITNALTGFKKLDSSGIDEFTNDVEPKLTPLQSLFSGLKNLFEGLWQVIKAVMPVVGAVFQLIGEGLKFIANALKNAFGNGSPMETLKKVLSVAFFTSAIYFLYNISAFFISFLNSFKMIFQGVADVLDSKAMMQYAEALKTFSIAILIIVASLVLLSAMDADQLTKSLAILTILATGMVLVMKAFSKMFSSSTDGLTSGFKNIIGIAKQVATMQAAAKLLLSFAGAIAILALTMRVLAKLDAKDITKSLLAIGALVTMMVVVSKVLSKQAKVMSRGTASLILFAIAIRLLVKPVKTLSKLDANALKKGIGALASIMLIMVLVSRLFKMKNAPALTAFTLDLIALSGGLLVLSSAIATMSLLKTGKMWSSIAAITVLLTVFALIGKVVKIADVATLGAFSATLIVLGVAMAELTASLSILSALPIGKVWNSVGVLLAFTAAMVGIAKLIGIFSSLKLIVFATGMLELGKALSIFSAVIVILGSMEMDALDRGRKTIELFVLAMIGIVKLVGILSALKLNVFATGMILLGVAMLEFATVVSILGAMEAGSLWKAIGAITAFVAVMVLLSKLSSASSSLGMVALGASLLTVSVGMLALASAIAIFGSMNLSTLLKGFGALVVTLAALTVVSKLLGPGVIVLLALGAALTMIATAALAFAAALTLIAGLGAAAGLALSSLMEALLNSIINLGPTIAQAAETLITSLLNALANSLTKIFEMIDSLLSNIINIVKNRGPEIISAVMLILTSLLSSLADNMPSIASSIITILISLLDALKNSASRIIQDVLDILFALIDAITDNIPTLLEKLSRFVITLVDGVVATIVKLVPKLINAAFDLVLGIIDGIGQALEDNTARVRETIINFAKHLWNAFLNFFGIHSPSTKAEEASGNIVLGIIKGLGKGVSMAVKAMVDLVKNMWNGIKSFLKNFLEFGKNIVKGIWDGIKNMWNGFVNFWKNLWNGIVDWFKNLFGIHSPSKLFYGYGQNTIEGYRNGMDDSQNGVYDSMEEIKENSEEIWDDQDIYNKYGELINKALADSLMANGGIIYETFGKLIGESLTILADSKDEFTNAVKDLLSIVQSELPEDALTITPVMNLDEIKKGTSMIAGMLSSVDGYSLDGSSALARQTLSDMSRTTDNVQASRNTETGTNPLNSNDNYNIVFNIYNNDPTSVAEEVDKKLQLYIDRRNKLWE